ncbi:GNAT family N-acetyltransferase [Sphingomonas sp.]|jgi:RimJ/RimL family protein N-acetyltransferase|uniref:GNAT family N-acetyltransferase n=1 Tax=Sphingomonas sp. TaxID=28214 RepID=UPI002D7ED988|nr:GNAT family N-acetyltransferase [Sphingomonas sp.]HEU0045019.1 GNAT family N-acetyltransferase [Sphingomonas sp.]
MIETARLLLRPWREPDKPAFHDLVNTPAMMAHFGGVTSRDRIDALLDGQMASQAADGCSMWAVEFRAGGTLAGICGLRAARPYKGTPVDDELEIGWRIGERWWGQGVAKEAAAASLAWGWANRPEPRIAAWTGAANTRSWGLMRRLGMTHRPELDYQHPLYAADDPIGAMIVYAIDRPRS